MKSAVIIANMGGPDSLESVEPFLFNIFSDPDIIDLRLPNFMRKRFAHWLARKRVDKSRDIYRQIGDKSPLLDITNQQAASLEKELNENGQDTFQVFSAMRYWHPLIEDVWGEIVGSNYDKIIAVSLYPFYSTPTTGSLVKLISKLQKRDNINDNKVLIADRYGSHTTFIAAMVDAIQRGLSEHREVKNVLLSAHSIPVRRIKKGDPYQIEIDSSLEQIKSRLPQNINVHLSYQSKLGPVKWLEPATPDKIAELANDGVTDLFVCPFGFVADNSETLYEIEILYKKMAKEKGIKKFIRLDCLNTDPLFIKALKEIVMQKFTESVKAH